MRIIKENTGAIIIDVQERLVPHMYGKDALVKNLRLLIQGLNLLGIPLLMCEQYSKGLGHTVEPIKDLLNDVKAIDKISFSGCDELAFMEAVRETSKEYLIVAGIETHICVQQTVIDLIGKGYVPIVIEDCVSSRNENDKRIAIERMRQEGAIISTYESILFELCRHADSNIFKAISNLVK